MLQRDAESLVTELQQLKDRNDTMMLKYQEAVVMLEQLQREKTYNYAQSYLFECLAPLGHVVPSLTCEHLEA